MFIQNYASPVFTSFPPHGPNPWLMNCARRIDATLVNHSQTTLFVFACFYSKGTGQDRTLGYTQAGQMLMV